MRNPNTHRANLKAKQDVTVLEEVSLFMPEGVILRGSLAWAGQHILCLGETRQVLGAAGPRARRIKLKGALVLPGFWDGHTHMLSGALEQGQVQLNAVKDRNEFREAIFHWVNQNPQEPWIVGSGWNDALWGGLAPSKQWVEDVSAGRPLFLLRYDMHSALVNSVALKLAGIGPNSSDPQGGRIIRDPSTGEPTGLLLEKAMELVARLIPPPSLSTRARLLSRALEKAVALGLTSIQDLVWDFGDTQVHTEVFSRQGARPRVFLRTPIEQLSQFLEARDWQWPSGILLQGVKGFLDGSLGSRSAWLRKPYEGTEADCGVSWVSDNARFREMVMEAVRQDVAVSLHAIGDAAIGKALELYHECIQRNLGRASLRIEHFQHPSQQDIMGMDHPRLTASVQPLHMVFDAAPTEQRLGPERARLSFPLRSLMELRCNVVFGSDWSVADLNPLLGIQAAVTRRDRDGRWPGGWIPDQCIGIEQALKAYTWNAARSVGFHEISGCLAQGRLADLTVLDRDITSCEPLQIPEARVLLTVVEGKMMYEDI
ncbi:MAG: amidohydrolase [bacterium]